MSKIGNASVGRPKDDGGCDLIVQLAQERFAFTAGETIYGTVHVNVKDVCEYKHLHLHLIGEEYAKYHYTTTHRSGSGKSSRTTTNHNDVENRVKIIDLTFELASSLEVGMYQFPFQVTLPRWLPNSFRTTAEFKNDRSKDGELKIDYQLKANYGNAEYFIFGGIKKVTHGFEFIKEILVY